MRGAELAAGFAISLALDDVGLELRYANWAGWAWHYAKGRPAAAQNQALEAGWLVPIVPNGDQLVITPAGRAELRRRQERAWDAMALE